MTDITPQDVVKTYRRYAPIYDFLFGAVLGPGRERMTEFVATLAPRTLLEVGVGTGLTLPRYPSQARIVGIDLSEDMLARAREQADALPDHDISLHAMDAENLEFEDGSFDCIAVPYVLSVTPNPDRLVSELRRVCKPGGHIVIVNHFSGGRFWWALEKMVKSISDRIGFRSEFDYERHILQHDWSVEQALSVNLFGLSKLVVIRNDSRAP
ncbi:class I SAM-dependent methyltransferase [Luteimonas sp. Y-2-2-4F]|nr:class I SAM-dependent methyltransferase [Luteimonas sp. Y-2-2-4F]MCD9030594.1 class I SAM-dependent methyltransferase [Luteimonas sp. Y-2-2-4F]